MFSFGIIGKSDWDAKHEEIAKLLFEEGMKLGMGIRRLVFIDVLI